MFGAYVNVPEMEVKLAIGVAVTGLAVVGDGEGFRYGRPDGRKEGN